MGLTLSVSEVLPIVADFATVLSFLCLITMKLLTFLPTSTTPLLKKQAVDFYPQLFVLSPTISAHSMDSGVTGFAKSD